MHRTDFPAVPEDLLARLRAARRVLAVTGAGISKESGIQTFREPGTGLWSRFLPEELASPRGWAQNPRRVWAWYAWRRQQVLRAQPNPAHQALAALELYYPTMLVVTQNVDTLHTRAGSRNVIELHGNITRYRCSGEGSQVEYTPAAVPDVEEGSEPEEMDVPACPRCGALLRPDVVWFGEAIPSDLYALAEEAARQADVCFVIGTSSIVYPAAALPDMAQRNGALLVEINPEPTPLTSQVDLSLRGPAGVMLPVLVELLVGHDSA
jgi:NAD-dependent deacetylase